VNGVCLTVTQYDAAAFTVGLAPETLRRTNLGDLRAGDGVNLERAVAAGGRMGGHYVQGHVDGVGTVRRVDPEGVGARMWFDAPPEVVPYIVEKGSIAVEGTSLTVAAVEDGRFAVALVPHTLEATTLGALEAGDPVNLEADVLAKYVERLLGR
jgi:riboflavin synthase